MKYWLCLAFLFLLVLPGCRREAPVPPTERNDLTIRFFRSLRNNEGEAAALQGQKLLEMEKRNYFLQRLIEIQQANRCTRNAQRHLNAGHLESAIKEIQSGLRRFPGNRELLKSLDQLRKLRYAGKYIAEMRYAPTPAAMNSALFAARNGFSDIKSPALQRYFKWYEESIKRKQRQMSASNEKTGAQVPIRSFDDK
ncbi:MAG: hypothetical protein E7048_03300 [Lentisphaerae bacterium]|nr:hypothetical protein [Lentisphaerota bacterium]